MDKQPKFAVGNRVDFLGKEAKIVQVHEQQYFYAGAEIYYLYDLEYPDGSKESQVFEAALQILQNDAKLGKRFCECGAWAVHWASNEHSNWCPAHRTFYRSDE